MATWDASAPENYFVQLTVNAGTSLFLTLFTFLAPINKCDSFFIVLFPRKGYIEYWKQEKLNPPKVFCIYNHCSSLTGNKMGQNKIFKVQKTHNGLSRDKIAFYLLSSELENLCHLAKHFECRRNLFLQIFKLFYCTQFVGTQALANYPTLATFLNKNLGLQKSLAFFPALLILVIPRVILQVANSLHFPGNLSNETLILILTNTEQRWGQGAVKWRDALDRVSCMDKNKS